MLRGMLTLCWVFSLNLGKALVLFCIPNVFFWFYVKKKTKKKKRVIYELWGCKDPCFLAVFLQCSATLTRLHIKAPL